MNQLYSWECKWCPPDRIPAPIGWLRRGAGRGCVGADKLSVSPQDSQHCLWRRKEREELSPDYRKYTHTHAHGSNPVLDKVLRVLWELMHADTCRM